MKIILINFKLYKNKIILCRSMGGSTYMNSISAILSSWKRAAYRNAWPSKPIIQETKHTDLLLHKNFLLVVSAVLNLLNIVSEGYFLITWIPFSWNQSDKEQINEHKN